MHQLRVDPTVALALSEHISMHSFVFFFVFIFSVPLRTVAQARWSTNGLAVAGGFGEGAGLNQLHFPFGLDIDDDGSLFIADTHNHRIVRWRPNARQGEIIAGGEGPNNLPRQLNEPLAVLIDRINRNLIISDSQNRRVLRWSFDQRRPNGFAGEVILSNIYSFSLAMDVEGSLYVSDGERHEVRRYGRRDRREGVIVAGGYGQGVALRQLSGPRHIFVDADQSLYVSEMHNHRVTKWVIGAREGLIVAGGHGEGDSLRQLHWPGSIFVDRMGSVYVVDQYNNRVMCWGKGAKEGEVLLGGKGAGSQNDQFNRPASVSLDKQGNLYIVDRDNHRVQRFNFQ